MAMGRPRAFDIDEALDQALHLFWEKGYEGTSLSDLTQAMGINRPSLYAAFGNKEELFRKALDRYAEGPVACMKEALNEPTARRVVERLLRGAVDAQTCPDSPKGCLAVQGAITCSDAAESIKQELIQRRMNSQDMLRLRLERAVLDGDLPGDTCPCDLSRYVNTVLAGMSVQAASGAGRDELHRTVDMALRAFPERAAA